MKVFDGASQPSPHSAIPTRITSTALSSGKARSAKMAKGQIENEPLSPFFVGGGYEAAIFIYEPRWPLHYHFFFFFEPHASVHCSMLSGSS